MQYLNSFLNPIRQIFKHLQSDIFSLRMFSVVNPCNLFGLPNIKLELAEYPTHFELLVKALWTILKTFSMLQKSSWWLWVHFLSTLILIYSFSFKLCKRYFDLNVMELGCCELLSQLLNSNWENSGLTKSWSYNLN